MKHDIRLDMRRDMRREGVWSWVLGAVFLAAWEALVRLNHTSPLVLPAPSVVAQSLLQGLASGYLWPHIKVTLTEVVLGLILLSTPVQYRVFI